MRVLDCELAVSKEEMTFFGTVWKKASFRLGETTREIIKKKLGRCT